MYAVKAWIGAAAAFLSTLLDNWTGGDDVFAVRDLIVGLLAAVVTFGAVYSVPNRGSNA